VAVTLICRVNGAKTDIWHFGSLRDEHVHANPAISYYSFRHGFEAPLVLTGSDSGTIPDTSIEYPDLLQCDAGQNLVSKKLPDVIPGLVGADAFARIPDVIRKLFMPDWVTYIPLTYLTDEYCENISKHHKLEPTVHLDPTTGVWTRKGDSLPD
jgi:hypothetical protein